MNQLHFPEADEAKEKAIKQAESGAEPLWKKDALAAVGQIASRYELFTADHVWWKLGERGHLTQDPRALGAIMRNAASNGWIRATDAYQPSSRIENHRRPVRIWKSLIVGEKVA